MGKTKSQVIREAIDKVYLSATDQLSILRVLQQSAGAWRRRRSGADYTEQLRSGRLARIHLKKTS